MPISKYYGGHGEEVKKAMQKEYGKDWERVFYATENKMKKSKSDKAKMMDTCDMHGKNPFFGNALPHQLGDGDRWFKDSRPMGSMFMKEKSSKKGKKSKGDK